MANYAFATLRVEGNGKDKIIPHLKKYIGNDFNIDDKTDNCIQVSLSCRHSALCFISEIHLDEWFKKQNLDWELIAEEPGIAFAEHIGCVNGESFDETRDYYYFSEDDIYTMTERELKKYYNLTPEDIGIIDGVMSQDYIDIGKYDFEYLFL